MQERQSNKSFWGTCTRRHFRVKSRRIKQLSSSDTPNQNCSLYSPWNNSVFACRCQSEVQLLHATDRLRLAERDGLVSDASFWMGKVMMSHQIRIDSRTSLPMQATSLKEILINMRKTGPRRLILSASMMCQWRKRKFSGRLVLCSKPLLRTISSKSQRWDQKSNS